MPGGRQQLQLRQQQQDRLELGEERDDRGEDRPEPALEPRLLARLGRRGRTQARRSSRSGSAGPCCGACTGAGHHPRFDSISINSDRALGGSRRSYEVIRSGRCRGRVRRRRRAGADFGRRVASRVSREARRARGRRRRALSVVRPRREAGRETRLLVAFLDHACSACAHTPLATGRSYTLTQYITPGDDWLRRGRIVGVVASRGPGRPRKTPGKQISADTHNFDLGYAAA